MRPTLSESVQLRHVLDELKSLVRQPLTDEQVNTVKRIYYALSQLLIQAKEGRHKNPISHRTALKYAKALTAHERASLQENPVSRGAREFISEKIRRLAHEGVAEPERIGAAYSMARRAGFKVPRHNVGAISERRLPSLRRGARRAFFPVRRRNPVLAVMGANPPAGADIEATWAKIEYCRPDDPEGKRVARVHEFPNGFVATPLDDGSILLRHPQGKTLWTRR